MDTTCPADPALAGKYQYTFGSAAPDFKVTSGQDVIKYGQSDGAIFRVEKAKDAPTIVSDFYIMWGKVEVVMKAAPGAGIVSSVVLESDDLDEIDWEWVGATPGEAQSNYFGKGNTGAYDRGATHPVTSQAQFHTYGVEWTAEKTDWLIDGNVVRTLTPSQVQGDFYPQTPMQLRIGSWAAGDPGNAQGTIEWSHGPTDYTKGPFDMVVQSIMVQDYSTGKEYTYSDKSGSSQSIKAVDGQINAGPQTGTGNADSLSSAVGSSSSIASTGANSGSSSFQAPTKSGLVLSSTSKSEPTSGSGSNNPANSSAVEATQTPSPSSGFSYGSGSSDSNPLASITTGAEFVAVTGSFGTGTGTGTGIPAQATNGTVPTAPASPSSSNPETQGPGSGAGRIAGASGVVAVVAAMVVGWLL